jgi:hypothetical protein
MSKVWMDLYKMEKKYESLTSFLVIDKYYKEPKIPRHEIIETTESYKLNGEIDMAIQAFQGKTMDFVKFIIDNNQSF